MGKQKWIDQWICNYLSTRTAIQYDDLQMRGEFKKLTNPEADIEEAVFLAEAQYEALQNYENKKDKI